MNDISDYQFKFSIVMAVYNVENYLNEAIDSIVNQSIGFEENVQLILVDDGSIDKSKDIAKDYEYKYPNNIIFLSKENAGQASARNLGLKHAKGKYLNFLDSDDYISKNTLQEVYAFFERHFEDFDVLAIPMVLFERVEGPHRLNNKFDKGNRVIDLSQEPNNPILSSSSSFIKAESFEGYEFDENLVNLEDALIINKILLEKKRYGVIDTCSYFYRQRSVRSSTVDRAQLKKGYFTQRLIGFYKDIIDYSISIEGDVPLFIQYLMAYDLQWLLKVPKLKVFDTKEEVREFWNYLYFVINHIGKDVILGNSNIEEDSRSFFMFLLNNDNSDCLDDNMEIDDSNCLNNDFYTDNSDLNFLNSFKNKEYVELENNKIIKKTDDYVIDTMNIHRIWLDVVDIKSNKLNVSGMFISNFNDEDYSIKVLKKTNNDVDEYACKKVRYNTPERNTRKYLGYDWKYIFNFDVEIPLKEGESCDLEFIIDYNDGNVSSSFEALLGTNHNLSLSEYSAFFSKRSYIVLYKDLRLHIVSHSYLSMLRYEYSNIKRALKLKPHFYKSSLLIKLIYYISYPFMKNKRIWIFSDRPNFADDNARHLFKYAINQNDDIKKYFAVNEDSSSFKEMKDIVRSNNGGSIIPFASLKHKLLYLFAEKAISSFTNEDFVNPFFEHDNRDLYAGLFTCDRLFLQHGVTKDDISKFVKKYNNNLSLIVAVSDLERESFLNEGYNYDENIIQVLGFPRFDNLLGDDDQEVDSASDCDKKQILFMPTWRLHLENEELFLNSDYFNSLNGLLNSKKLHKLLNEHGYKLVFKPHAELMQYIDLIDICDDVYLSLDDSYQDLFKDSSLLITDYSSVFFDFAYLKKPVIYYQTGDDYHYGKSYFDYETMGFGEVIGDEDALIERINDYLENGCIMEDGFKENVDRFFKFIDRNNCERVYKWILEH